MYISSIHIYYKAFDEYLILCKALIQGNFMIWMTDNREYDRECHQPLYLQIVHPWIQPTLDQKYLKKIPESSPNQNLNL